MNSQLLHALLLLSDSALPLGAFAFSSGLESYLAQHHSNSSNRSHSHSHLLLPAFLSLSLASVSQLSVPYLLSAHASPELLPSLTNDLDASTACPVARRASTSQGRALLALWERSFRPVGAAAEEATSPAETALAAFATLVKSATAMGNDGDGDEDDLPPPPSAAHLAPLFGVVAAAMQIPAEMAGYAFLLGHARAVLSAAVRAGAVGPYQAQRLLSGTWLRAEIERGCGVARAVGDVAEAGQVWVGGDLWAGRHELLYSRIFNS